MDEAELRPLLQSAQRGEVEAFDHLAAEVFPGIYDFIAGLERDPEAAARLATEGLVHLAESMGNLTVPTWRAGVFSAVWRVLDREGYLLTPDEDWEPTPGVRDSVAALGPRRGALLDLHLRHGLAGDELSRVLGVSRSAGRLVVRRLLVSAESEFATAAAPLAAYAAQAPITAPVRLRANALAAARERWPGPRPIPMRRSLPPLPPVASHVRIALSVAAGLLVAAVALAVSLLLPASPIALTRKTEAPLPASQPTGASTVVFVTATARPTSTRTPTPVRTAAATRPASTAGTSATTAPRPPSSSPTSSSAPSPSSTPSVPATATPTRTSTATPVRPTPTATSTVCVTTISVGVSILPAQPGVRTFFPLSNLSSCGSASYGIVADVPWIQVEPSGGQIVPLGQVRIDVLADPPAGAGTYRARLTITGAGQAPLVVEVVVTRG